MKKFILILFSAFLLTACSSVASQKDDSEVEEISKVLTSPPIQTEVQAVAVKEPEQKRIPSIEKDGVTIAIQNVQRVDSQTIVKIMMDNHKYDLSGMDVLSGSNFDGIKAVDYKIEKTLMGGHHVNATITFPGDVSGTLVVGLNNNLTFNFDIS